MCVFTFASLKCSPAVKRDVYIKNYTVDNYIIQYILCAVCCFWNNASVQAVFVGIAMRGIFFVPKQLTFKGRQFMQREDPGNL